MLAHPWLKLAFALLATAPPPSLAPDEDAPLDARVWTAEGRQVQLRSYWGKPTVLIYESRRATELNRTLKDALWRRGKDPSARDAAQVLGVAALRDLDWWPARSLAENAVRARQERAGIPVLIDWEGALAGGAWQLRLDTSSVLVLDGRGRVVFRAAGALDAAQVRHVFLLLEELTGRRA